MVDFIPYFGAAITLIFAVAFMIAIKEANKKL